MPVQSAAVASGNCEAEQLAALRAVLAEALPANRFHRKRLEGTGVSPDIGSLSEFSTRCPLTTKAELAQDQNAHPPYGTNLTYPLERYARFCQTSGTTARPLSILDTPESWEWMLGNWQQIYRAGGISPQDRMYFAFSFGPFLGFWTAFEAAARLGCLCLPGGGLSSEARLRAMLAHEATALCCTPTYALRLAEVAREAGISVKSVRKILVAGEPGGSIPSVRERIAAAWDGAEVLDHYGLTEVGPTAYQLSGAPGTLYVMQGAYYAEILDAATSAPVAPGETGELVLTTLGRTACPLLRYRTGDLAKRVPGIPEFGLQGGIIGRADDMIVVRGVNIYPTAVDAVVRAIPCISEYRVRVSRRGELTEVALQIESSEPHAASLLETALTSAFSLRIPVEEVAAGTLPRFELKARRWER